MTNFLSLAALLAPAADATNPLHGSEIWTVGLSTFGIGILAIFAILIVLIGVIYLMRLIKYLLTKAPAQAPPTEQTTRENGLSPEIVAAITAAVAVALEAEREEPAAPVSFRIRSIRRRV